MTVYPLWLTDLCSEATNQKMRVYKSPSCHKSNHQMVSTKEWIIKNKLILLNFYFSSSETIVYSAFYPWLFECLVILINHTLNVCRYIYPHLHVIFTIPSSLDKSCYQQVRLADARDLHLYYRVFANKSEQPFQSELVHILMKNYFLCNERFLLPFNTNRTNQKEA